MKRYNQENIPFVNTRHTHVFIKSTIRKKNCYWHVLFSSISILLKVRKLKKIFLSTYYLYLSSSINECLKLRLKVNEVYWKEKIKLIHRQSVNKVRPRSNYRRKEDFLKNRDKARIFFGFANGFTELENVILSNFILFFKRCTNF